MRYRIAQDVAWLLAEEIGSPADEVYLMRLPDGRPLVLAGSSALIWIVAADGGDLPGAIAEATGLPAERIAADVTGFVETLVREGYLIPESLPPAEAAR